MSCNNTNSCNPSPCGADIPYPQISSESVPSLIENLVYALYGTINKTVCNGRVIWNIPCDPNNTTEVDQIPREEGEGLLCYLLRIFSNTLDGYGSFLRWSFAGTGQTNFPLTGAWQTDRNGYLAYIDGVVQDPINYTISTSLPRTLIFSTPIPSGSVLTVIELSSRAGATGPAGNAGPVGGQRWGYTGNGSQVDFNITGGTTTNTLGYSVNIDGVTQDPNNYSISGTTLTMSSAVPSGSEIVIISLNGIQGATGATGVLPPTNFGNTWVYAGNGIQTVFSITGGLSILSPAYLVCIDGVYQKSTNYTVNNVIPRTLTFLTAIPNGSELTILSLSVA